MNLVTDKGHFWIRFNNGYTLSVFNGYGSYSDNHHNEKYAYPIGVEELIRFNNIKIKSNECEIAIISPDGNLVTEDYLDTNDSVKGYVDINELIEIINLVNNI